MSADIVEGVDIVLTIPSKNKVITRHLVAEPVARVLQSGAVCDENPSPGEYGTAFELVHFGRCIP